MFLSECLMYFIIDDRGYTHGDIQGKLKAKCRNQKFQDDPALNFHQFHGHLFNHIIFLFTNSLFPILDNLEQSVTYAQVFMGQTSY